MQAAAEAVAQRSKKGSEISGQPANLQAAVVAIDPPTGRVLAYYGGDNGTGTDYAGKNTDAAGNITGGHPPGSTFKVYTLAAGLNAGVSLDSHWKGNPFTIEGTRSTSRTPVVARKQRLVEDRDAPVVQRPVLLHDHEDRH